MDPEVLHTNPNVPIDEDGTGSEAIFAGLNDEHVLLVQAKSLVGNSEIVDGPAETIIPILPLVINNRELYLDQTAFNVLLAGLQAQITALQARATADEALIAANSAAIANNAAATNAAVAVNAAAISVLQQQLAILTQQFQDLSASIRPTALQPVGRASLAGRGLLAATNLALLASVSSLASLAGAGSFGAELGKVPKVLSPGGVAGAGNLTAVLGAIAALRANLVGAGQLSVDALVKSLIVKQGDWLVGGAGSLSAAMPNSVLAARATLAGSGVLLSRAGLPFLRAALAGAGAVPLVAVSQTTPNSKWNPADKDANAVLSSNNTILTATSAPSGARGSQSRNSGKRYFTVNLGLSQIGQAGLATAAAPLNNTLGADVNGWGVFTPVGTYWFYHNSVSISTSVTIADNDVLNVAYDAGTGNIWFGINGVYFSSTGAATGNPVAGTSPTYTVTAGTALFPIGILTTSAASLTINTAPSGTPSGFTNWG